MTPRSRRMFRARFAIKFTLSENQRAQGRPGACCTRGLACQMRKQKRTRAYRFSGGNPAFPAQWFYGLYALSQVTGLVCHLRARNDFRELDASVGASGPHDFAVRI